MMRILMVGAGAVGGYFGARLAAAGREVNFLVRPGRAERLRADGLVVGSPEGDVTIDATAVGPMIVGSDELGPDYDVIVLTVKAYGLAAALDDLAPAMGPRTVIIPTLNGMAHLDQLRERFGDDHVFGGVCVIAAQLDPDGAIRHLGLQPSLRFGELDGSVSPRVQEILATFEVPGFAVSASDKIIGDLWNKWVFLSSAAAITCLLNGSVGAIAAAGGVPVASAIIDETTSVATAAGYPPSPAADARTRSMLTASGSDLTASMFRDLRQGLPIERAQIIGDLVERGRRAGLSLPLLSAADVALKVYEQGRQG